MENPAPVPSGAIFDKAPWVNPFNCLRTEPGNKASELVDGLVKYSVTPTTCDGRIGLLRVTSRMDLSRAAS